jgi:hypothetical protein
MRKNVTALFLALIFFTFTTNIIGQDIKLLDYTTNTNPKNFKRIFIVGAGSIASRVFLENLSNKLIEDLGMKGIKAEYYYLGKKERGSAFDIKNLPIKGFDALIVFNPTDTSVAKVGAKSLDSIPGHAGIKIGSSILFGGTSSTYMYYVNYKEKFDILLYETINTSNPIWEASLKVNGDFSKNKIYLKAVKKIISSLINNFLIPEKNNE